MANLGLTWSDLKKETAYALGYGRSDSLSNAAKQSEVEDLVHQGTRWALYPATIPGTAYNHEWSFLKPIDTIVLWKTTATITALSNTYNAGTGLSTLTMDQLTPFYPSMVGATLTFDGEGSFTIAGYTSSKVVTLTGDSTGEGTNDFYVTANGDYRLPADCEAVYGDLWFETGEGHWLPLPIVPVEQIGRMRQSTSSTARPCFAAVVWNDPTGTADQTKTLQVYPTPDQNYTVYFIKQLAPDKLADAATYPPGGPEMAEVYLAACKAAAKVNYPRIEQDYFNTFLSVISAQIKRDSSRRAPETLGMMVDTSRRMTVADFRDLRRMSSQTVLRNGASIGD